MKRRERASTGPFPAQFFGRCANCDEGIVPPEMIRATGDGYVHDICNDPLGDDEPCREICRTCWLEKSVSGACGCEED